MLMISRPVFGSGKAVVLNSGFCVTKFITELKSKVFYVASQTKKRSCWSNGVPGDPIYTHFEDKEVGDVVMIEARTEYNKLFEIFCMKDPDYVMKIMASWVMIDELEGARTRGYFIDSSRKKEANQFTYWKPFLFHFRYLHQVDKHNNWKHAPISL